MKPSLENCEREIADLERRIRAGEEPLEVVSISGLNVEYKLGSNAGGVMAARRPNLSVLGRGFPLSAAGQPDKKESL